MRIKRWRCNSKSSIPIFARIFLADSSSLLLTVFSYHLIAIYDLLIINVNVPLFLFLYNYKIITLMSILNMTDVI